MGRTVVGFAGGGGAGGAGVLTLFGAYNPRPGSRWWRVVACGLVVTVRGGEIDTVGRGRGALPAVACDSWWWWWVVVAASGGGAPSFGCVAWCWVRGAFPLVVGWVGGNDFPR